MPTTEDPATAVQMAINGLKVRQLEGIYRPSLDWIGWLGYDTGYGEPGWGILN